MAAAVHHLPLFIAAALLVNLTPGPDMLFVATSSVSHGRRAGGLAALGVGTGCLLHVALAALGLSALLAASAPAFLPLRWVGAAYLVWMGLSMWRVRGSAAAGSDINSPVSKVFWQGVWTNALNPKVALFFLAFLPQFIDPDADGQAVSFVLLGLLFSLGGTLVNLTVALLASGLGRRLAGAGRAAWLVPVLRRGAGLLFVALGLKLAFDSR